MKKMQNPSLRKRKGFTLIELIVVIAILAILAAIAIPAFLGTLTNAKNKADLATQQVVKSAVLLYIAENPTVVPTSIEIATVSGYLADYATTKWSNGALLSSTDIDVTAAGVVTVPIPAAP